jgi:hypothetical protein
MSEEFDRVHARYVTVNNARVLITLILLCGMCSRSFGQNDGTPARTYTQAVNLQHDTTITTDSVLAFTIPAGSVIERVIWKVDTTLSGTDSLQLRAGESQRVICSYLSTGGDDIVGGEIQLCVPNRTFPKSETLRIILYVAEGKTGQFRLIIIYRELI